jgi:hypothetical protein
LTAEIDPLATPFVRFYHENFQRDKPELLVHIKRATKGDQQSKDDLDTLRNDISNLKDLLRNTVTDYDRKLAELSYECNRRISSMNAEYDKLAALVQHVLGVNVAANSGFPHTSSGTAFFINGTNLATSLMPSQLGAPTNHATQVTASFPQMNAAAAAAMTVASGSSLPSMPPAQNSSNGADMLRSLSQAAELHNNENKRGKTTGKRSASGSGTSKKKPGRAKRD